MSGIGKMILSVYSLSNEKNKFTKASHWPSQYIINVFKNKKKHTQNKKHQKTCFYRKMKHIKYVLNNYAMNPLAVLAYGAEQAPSSIVARLLTPPTRGSCRVGSENLQESSGRVQFGHRLKLNFKLSRYMCFILHFVCTVFQLYTQYLPCME